MLYIDEISGYIERGGCRGESLLGTWIPLLLLYADDLVLLVDLLEGP